MSITKDNIVFTTACVDGGDVNAGRRMIHWLQDSCKRFGIELRPYGMGESYKDWRQIKITLWVPWLKRLREEGFSHVFYTDGRDSFMLCGADEVIDKYNAMGCPKYLISCEDQCYPFPGLSEKVMARSKPRRKANPWKYLGAGQMMGEISYMIELWEELEKRYGDIPKENHDQGWLELGFADGVMLNRDFVLDHDCHIFQTASLHRLGGDVPNYIELGRLEISHELVSQTPRVYNPITGTYPCAIHFPGGYSSPVSAKDHSLGPVWNALFGDNEYVRHWMRGLENGLMTPALQAWMETL